MGKNNFGIRINSVSHYNDMCLDLLDSIRSLIEGHNFRVYKMIRKWIMNTFEESSGKMC